jgi:hypothetical protein
MFKPHSSSNPIPIPSAVLHRHKYTSTSEKEDEAELWYMSSSSSSPERTINYAAGDQAEDGSKWEPLPDESTDDGIFYLEL